MKPSVGTFALLSGLLAQSGDRSVNPLPPVCQGVQRFVVALSGQYLAVEVLADDLVHFEASSGNAVPTTNPLYVSQMIDSDNYSNTYACGPTSYAKTATGFTTSALQVT
ncbi:hypothetical protein HDU91_003905, partial [Kappamyces sp. JEL0680]